ncbi:MAG TPA: hypothetical protein QGH10_20175, partial [Armatimonadota bacterium]|nr:hypothetical protein [Armatimonadota bacterium]
MRAVLSAGSVLGFLTSICPAALAAGTITHNTASLTAAKLAPEPFASNWKKCGYANHPDFMRDQPLGHENMRTAGLLYTLEAIRYLREGQINRAMMCASARSHYITDSACIPHAEIWRPRHEDDVLRPGDPSSRPWSFMPASVQDYWLPFGERAEGTHYEPMLIDTPPGRQAAWEALRERNIYRSMHGFFDSVHGQAPYPDGFPTATVPEAEYWSCYDREFYARWRAECIALTVLDRESVLDDEKGVRFVDAEAFQAAMDDEMRNMSAAVLAYYRYLSVASQTDVQGDVDQMLPSADRLALIARRAPAIHLSPEAPWPLKRAAYLLAMELVRAEHRLRGRQGREYGEGLMERCDALIRTTEMPGAEADRRLIVSWREDADVVAEVARREISGNVVAFEAGEEAGGHIILRGEDLQNTIHLVDYLLDLTHAPLNGRTPVEVMFNVFAQEWPGTPLLDELRRTPDAEIYQPHLERPPCPHVDDMAEWTDKVHWMIWPNAQGDANLSGPLPV